MSLSSMRGFARECTSMATEQFPNSLLLIREPSAPSLKTTPVSRQPWMVFRVMVGEVWAPLTLMADPAMLQRSHCSTRQLPCVTSIKAGARTLLTRDGKLPTELSLSKSLDTASRSMVKCASRTVDLSSSIASDASRKMVIDLPLPMISTAWSTCNSWSKRCSPVRSLTPKAGIRLRDGTFTPGIPGVPPARSWARLAPM
mmetsp:Transcript_142575/g.443422  ORF Transcript_142575/g.443422 Transcript_142575/m.443422 type:complete len:200 (-) Transcript_142575:360-959(-)